MTDEISKLFQELSDRKAKIRREAKVAEEILEAEIATKILPSLSEAIRQGKINNYRIRKLLGTTSYYVAQEWIERAEAYSTGALSISEEELQEFIENEETIYQMPSGFWFVSQFWTVKRLKGVEVPEELQRFSYSPERSVNASWVDSENNSNEEAVRKWAEGNFRDWEEVEKTLITEINTIANRYGKGW